MGFFAVQGIINTNREEGGFPPKLAVRGRFFRERVCRGGLMDFDQVLSNGEYHSGNPENIVKAMFPIASVKIH